MFFLWPSDPTAFMNTEGKGTSNGNKAAHRTIMVCLGLSCLWRIIPVEQLNCPVFPGQIVRAPGRAEEHQMTCY